MNAVTSQAVLSAFNESLYSSYAIFYQEKILYYAIKTNAQ